MKLEPTNSQTSNSTMTYGDFLIRFEHTFIRNIFSEEQLCPADQLKLYKIIMNFFKGVFKYVLVCLTY